MDPVLEHHRQVACRGGTRSAVSLHLTSLIHFALKQHVYFFAVPGVYADTIPGRICQETANRRVDGFNIFVGEFSLQAQLGNTFAGRQAIYDSQVRAFQQYLSGGTFWTARFEVSFSLITHINAV